MQSHSGRLVNAKRQFEEQKIYDAIFILGKKIALRVVMHVYTKRENKIDNSLEIRLRRATIERQKTYGAFSRSCPETLRELSRYVALCEQKLWPIKLASAVDRLEKVQLV